ncbi:MAG: hypothetical protein R3E60_00305 [Alphaproteobacteria bacterium]
MRKPDRLSGGSEGSARKNRPFATLTYVFDEEHCSNAMACWIDAEDEAELVAARINFPMQRQDFIKLFEILATYR